MNRKKTISATLRFCASLLLAIASLVQCGATLASEKPNIVIIFIDDMGYGDIEPFGSTHKTPDLDQMATEGMKLTSFYVSSSACTPSRTALMTGCYADRIGMGQSVVFPADKRGLNPNEITIAEILKKGGYATGCFGKWHLGDHPSFMPNSQGFDEYEGIPYSNDMWIPNKRREYPPLPWIKQNKPVAHIPDEASQAVLADAITDAAVDFITRHKDEPFFAYVPHSAVHAPFMTKPERLAAAGDDVMAALISEVDNSVGRILQTLRELDLAENTFVLFTNDNGGGGKTSPGPLRGAKFGPKYEGHMRVATLAWWPGKIPAGRVSSQIMTTTDVLPTVAKLTGQPVPTDRVIDGKDVSDILLGKDGAKSPHETLYYENDGIRQGKWKLVHYRVKANWFTELYDLEADLGERNNIADQHPDRVKAMKAALDAHVAEVEKNARPAAFVENPKPLLADASGLPTLAEYVGQASSLPASAGPHAGNSRHDRDNRPDVLFIAIDDMNDWTTLFDEDNPIQTPNLKRLAARGAFFSKAYCAVPACNPSRTAILTGLSPVTSGVYGNGQSWKQMLPDVVTLPQYFGHHGFTTKGGGKIFHHGGTGTDRADNPSFDEFFKLRIHSGKPATNYNGYVRGDRKTGPLGGPGWDWGVHDVDRQTDEYTVEYVSQVMKSESREKPLFLAAGIFRPHLPFWAPPESFNRYPFDEVKLPPRPGGDLDDVPPLGVQMSRTESFIFDNAIKPPEDRPGSLRKMLQCYQASADYADQMVGHLIDQLDKTGRADNTIIVLWSDHGYHLGDKNATVKFTLWEKANHVPLIIVAPGVTNPGTVIDRPVSLLDIYPTLVELAGLPKKDGLDGVSLVPLLKDPNTEWNRPAVMTQGKGNHAVRSDRWRYIRYYDGSEELYDHDSDPWEHTNMASDPKHSQVIAQHKKWLPKTPEPKAAASVTPKPRRVPKPAASRPNRNDVTPAEYKTAENDILIADFEGDDYGNWEVIGEAMSDRPSQADTHKNRAIGYLGKGFINTYLDGDKKTGELASPPFRIERKHINFLIGGGNHPGQAGIQLRVDDKTVRYATGRSLKNSKNQEIMDWQSLDVSEFIGKQAVIKIVDKHSGGWGHTVVDHIFQSDKPMPSSIPATFAAKPTATRPATSSSPTNSAGFVPPPKPGVTLKDEWSTFPLYDQVGHDQSLRPQFHFTSRMGWLNDPNGMVYYDGEWHMLFQHYAKGNASGAKSWGNAVSTDLMHWKQLSHAINPYPNVKWKDGNIHAIWSGSAVVDELNALGRQKGDVKTLYAIYTATHSGEDGKAAFFQGAAYSTDKGRTWTKINGGKPVIDHQEGYSGGQRDPRVFYYAPGKYYVVIMMVGGPDRAVRLWKSTDLLNWKIIGDIPNKAAECIDMYHVAVDGDPNNRKWVISDAGTHYEVGEFDGTTWRGLGDKDKDDKHLRFDYGDAWYAAQAFNQGPDGRTVHVGWLRSKQPGYRPFLEANMPFTQQMSIPVEITLRTTPDGIRMFRNPVKEIKDLYSKSTKLNDLSVKEANAKLAELTPQLVDLTLTFQPKGNMALNVRGLTIRYDSEKQEVQFTNKARVEGEKTGMLKLPKERQRPYRDNGLRTIPAPMVDGQVTVRALVDRASLELFVNDGQSAASFVVVPNAANRRIAIEGNDELKLNSLVVNELKSIWPPELATRSVSKANITLPQGESGSQARRGPSPAATASDLPASGRVNKKSLTNANLPPSREIKITGKHLLLPIAPRKAPDRSDNPGNSFHIMVDGVLVHQFWANVARSPEQIEFWSYLDMSEFVGKSATAQLIRGTREGAEDALALFESSDTIRSLKPLYTEQGRPQFHFSQKIGWNNDVNGMVYSDGLYHLAWQCNPVGRQWNNMYWGHAVSKDLVYWEEWPRMIRVGGAVVKDQPIHPAMSLGPAFSGSACVDHNNTLGKQVGDTKTLIACFSDVGGGDQSKAAKGEKFVGESLAYSTDNGRTYRLLRDVNPIISHRGRDPKLFWYEPGQHWCIVTYRAAEKTPQGVSRVGKMAFYISKNLKDWNFASFSDPVFHECPDFVELPVDGDPQNKKWLLFDATPKYQIGSFDGRTFTPEFKGTRQTIGGSLKAAQCFSNAPDGRAICMVWSRARYGDDVPFNQGFTLPIELSLKTTDDGIRCYANPLKELEALRDREVLSIENQNLKAGENAFTLPAPEELIELNVTLHLTGNPQSAHLKLGDTEVPYDFTKREFPRHRMKVYDLEDGKLDLRIYMDRATVEVFAENGSVYYLEGRKHLGASLKGFTISVDGGSATIEKLKAFRLKSIWHAK